jgi:GPH family glycoside/pentoside/hexuronide:cation symporter
MNNNRLSVTEKIGYGLGDFGSNIVFQTILILLPAFYTDVFGLAPVAMGTMFLVVRLLDTVTDPLMGMIADNTHTRWGQFRPYLLWFAVPFGIVFVLTYTTPDFSNSGKLLYAYATYSALMLLYTVVNIPYCALGGALTPDSKERVSANSYRFFLATFAGVLITYFGPDLIASFGDGDEKAGYPWAMGVFSILAVAAFFGCFALTRERVHQASSAKGSFKLDLLTLFRNDQWLLVAVMFLILLVPIVLRGGSAIYYIKWFAERPDLVAAFLTAGTVSQMIGATFASPISRLTGNRVAYILVQTAIVFGSVGLYFAPSNNLIIVFSLFIWINFFVQMGAPLLFSMAADTVDYGELRTGRRVTGLAFSGALFALKLGVALGGWLIGFILAWYGYDGKADMQTPEAIRGLVLSMTLFPAIGHALLIPFAAFYKLDHQKCLSIRTELDHRKSN